VNGEPREREVTVNSPCPEIAEYSCDDNSHDDDLENKDEQTKILTETKGGNPPVRRRNIFLFVAARKHARTPSQASASGVALERLVHRERGQNFLAVCRMPSPRSPTYVVIHIQAPAPKAYVGG
jgi:hypothetical protein